MSREELVGMAKVIEFPSQNHTYLNYGHVGKEIHKLEFDKDLFYNDWRLNEHHIKPYGHFCVTIPKIAELLGLHYNPANYHFVEKYSGKYDISMPHPNNDVKVDIIPHNDIPEQVVIENADWSEVLVSWKQPPISDYHGLYKYAHMSSTIINRSYDWKEDKTILILGDSHMIPVVPILIPCCRQITYIDNRNNTPIYDKISGYRYTDVLINLYDKPWSYYTQQNLR